MDATQEKNQIDETKKDENVVYYVYSPTVEINDGRVFTFLYMKRMEHKECCKFYISNTPNEVDESEVIDTNGYGLMLYFSHYQEKEDGNKYAVYFM